MTPLIDAPQGSAPWHAARAKHFCASEAAAALGLSKYTTRDELLRQKATGLTEEVGAAKQRIFDAGHEAEAKARPIAEEIAGVEFYPIVATLEVEGMALLASFDGIDLMDEVIWEHKLLNQSLVEQVAAGDLEPHYYLQLEHQLLVSGAQRALFTTSDGTPEGTHPLWYESKPERRAQLIAGWKQFALDLAAWVPPEAAAVVNATAKVRDALPALIFDAKGEVTACNVDEFKAEVLERINTVNTSLVTDQDFADGEADAKWLRDVAAGMKSAMMRVRGGMISVNEVITTLEQLEDMAVKRALAVEKLVKARKDEIRAEIVAGGAKDLAKHMAALNDRLEHPYMPQVPADFGGAVKGKRTLDSLRNAVNTELARAKIEASAIADRIDANLKTMHRLAGGYTGMFPDAQTLVLKAADDFEAAVNLRVAERVRRENERLEAERERIRQEEAAKLQREAEARARAEAAELARQQDEAARKASEYQGNLTGTSVNAQPVAINSDDDVVDAEVPRGAILPVAPIAPENVIKLISAAPAERPGTPTLKLGQIAERLGFTLTADFLKGLGFEPAATDRASKLYFEADFPLILAALVRHIEQVQAKAAA